jgi:F0F1-type ATP synthase assembly protein I
MVPSNEASPAKKKSNQSNDSSGGYLKYSGLAIQLLAAIGLLGWVGHLLDGYLNFQFPVFMLIFGFLAFAGMLYQIYRTVNR